ncbi:MAG: ComF family protein [Desulfovibrio sp.]
MSGALGTLLRSFGRRTGIFQVRCPACGVPVEPIRADRLCPACALALRPREGGFCPACGGMFGLESYEPMLCGECRVASPPWERFFFHARYDDPLRGLIIAFKYNARLEQAALLRNMAAQAWERALCAPSAVPPPTRPGLVIPVPLHEKRLLWRGFNQSLELASAVAARAGAPLAPAALRRLRDTRPQSTLSGAERLTNLHGAFEADTALVRGKRALLVDDVCTTGATLRECAKSLLLAGVKAVDVLVLARA